MVSKISSNEHRFNSLNSHEKVLFITNACEEGRLEVEKLKIFAMEAGAFVTKKASQADYILYYACGHLTHNDDEAVRIIKHLNAIRKSSSKLIVWGCLPKINPKAINNVYTGPFVGPNNNAFFANLFNHSEERMNHIYANIPHSREGTLSLKTRLQIYRFEKLYCYTGKTWHIKIVSGCRYHCAYCSDQLAYKTINSIPVEDIINQIGKGLKVHIKHFYFVGRDLGSYGYDNNKTLSELLNRINEVYTGQQYKISLFNVSPPTLIENFPRINQEFISNHIFQIGSHIQSGSENILHAMGKSFSLNDWVKTMKTIRQEYPHIRLATSLMVGFPGETNSDIQKTLDLLHYLQFDRIDIYLYSPRPNLPSLKLIDIIPHTEKIKRLEIITKAAKANRFKRRFPKISFLS